MAQHDSHYNDANAGGSSRRHGRPQDRDQAFPPAMAPRGNMQFPPTSPPVQIPMPPVPDWNWNNNTSSGASTFPAFPTDTFGQVRFLNASTNTFDVDFAVDGNTFVQNSRFGSVSDYDWIADGFHTITVRRSTSIRTVLYQQSFPFVAGEKVTMVLTDSESGGLNLIRMVDTSCSNIPVTASCYRFANVSYSGSAVDVLLNNGETVFHNVTFQTATPYKQAVAGTYQFFVTNTNLFTTLRELPIILIGAIGTGSGIRQPILTYQANFTAGRSYTSYLIGNTWSDNALQVLTVED